MKGRKKPGRTIKGNVVRLFNEKGVENGLFTAKEDNVDR